MAARDLSWQPSMLDADAAPSVDASFATIERIALDEASWVDLAPDWVSGADALFGQLVATTAWGQRSRWMYTRRVDEPRLTAGWRADSGQPLEPPVLEEMRRALSDRYGVELDSMGLNLYRDGADSVAWHGDKITPDIDEPVVALVSLGSPRKFLLRPKGGGRSCSVVLGAGDLLVTGGMTQRRWEHSVPKARAAGPRISIAFRHGLDPSAYSRKQTRPV